MKAEKRDYFIHGAPGDKRTLEDTIKRISDSGKVYRIADMHSTKQVMEDKGRPRN